MEILQSVDYDEPPLSNQQCLSFTEIPFCYVGFLLNATACANKLWQNIIYLDLAAILRCIKAHALGV